MNYTKLGITELQTAMKNGELTSKALVTAYIKSISTIDSCENGLNSVAEINPDAISIAEELDIERATGELKGPMHGIPVMIKDNINTADNMHTTAGSLVLKNNYAPYDAGLITNLRKAGAIILAKTNMTEFANFMSNDMPNGYSSRGGQVLCPYARTVDPSGSSTGSAVAVASYLTSVSIGTETDGSILAPARTNGVVGIKPTKGLIPSKGIVPISGTLDTAGPMARCVNDAAILLEAMTGKKQDYVKGLNSYKLEGIRIGLNSAYIDYLSKERLTTLNIILKALKNEGAIIVEGINLKFSRELSKIMVYEFKSHLNHYLSTLPSGFPIKTLDDIIKSNTLHKESFLKYGQNNLVDANYYSKEKMIEPEYLNILAEREKTITMIDDVMNEKKVDIILDANVFHSLSAYAGFPSITIPTGMGEDAMPTGTLLMARRYDESTLIKVAYVLEQVLGLKMSPPGLE